MTQDLELPHNQFPKYEMSERKATKCFRATKCLFFSLFLNFEEKVTFTNGKNGHSNINPSLRSKYETGEINATIK